MSFPLSYRMASNFLLILIIKFKHFIILLTYLYHKLNSRVSVCCSRSAPQLLQHIFLFPHQGEIIRNIFYKSNEMYISSRYCAYNGDSASIPPSTHASHSLTQPLLFFQVFSTIVGELTKFSLFISWFVWFLYLCFIYVYVVLLDGIVRGMFMHVLVIG